MLLLPRRATAGVLGTTELYLALLVRTKTFLHKAPPHDVVRVRYGGGDRARGAQSGAAALKHLGVRGVYGDKDVLAELGAGGADGGAVACYCAYLYVLRSNTKYHGSTTLNYETYS